MYHDDLAQKKVANLLSRIQKTTCQGSDCLNERGVNGFFRPGLTPWIGYPTNIRVKLLYEIVSIDIFKKKFPAHFRLVKPLIRLKSIAMCIIGVQTSVVNSLWLDQILRSQQEIGIT